MAKLRVKLNKYQIAAQEVTEVMGWEIDDQGNIIDVENWTDDDIISELRKAAAAREPGDEFTPPTAALLDELMVPDPEETVPVAKAEVKASTKAKAVVPKASANDKTEEVETKVEEPVEVKAEKKVGKLASDKSTTQAPKAETKVEPKAEVKVEKKAAVKEVPVKEVVEPLKEALKATPKAKKVEKKVPAKAKKAKKDEGPKTRKPREQKKVNHAMMLVRELVVKNPDISISDLQSALTEAGYPEVHKNSIVVRRMEMRHCLSVLNALGLLKKSKI